MDKILAPLVLFVYNRPEHTLKTIQGLKQNKLALDTSMFVFSDGPKTDADAHHVKKVREIIAQTSGFKSISLTLSESNKGLAASIISGVSAVLEKYNRVIVMEDDLECSADFLNFMNEALNRYENEEKVFSVTGYNYPFKSLKDYPHSSYFSYRGSSWSWATWKDRWQTIDWDIKERNLFLKDVELQKEFNKGGNDLSAMLMKQLNGEIDSWAIRFAYNASIQNKIHCLATKGKVNNIGQDNSGTHSKKTSKYKVLLQEEDQFHFPEEIVVDQNIHNELKSFFKKTFTQKLFTRFKNSSLFRK